MRRFGDLAPTHRCGAAVNADEIYTIHTPHHASPAIGIDHAEQLQVRLPALMKRARYAHLIDTQSRLVVQVVNPVVVEVETRVRGPNVLRLPVVQRVEVTRPVVNDFRVT